MVTSSVPRAEPVVDGSTGVEEAVGRAARARLTEEAENAAVARSRSTGGEQARPALAPECLADLLVWRPGPPPGARNREAHPPQVLRGREIGDFKSRIDRPGPQISRHLLMGGMPASARCRYHSAHTVASSLARYTASTIAPRCQRPSGGGPRRASGSTPWTVWRHHRRGRTATASTSSATVRRRRALPDWRRGGPRGR